MKNDTTRVKPEPKTPARPAAASIGDDGIGEIKIHENVISSLARLAALEVDGVARLAGNALVDNLAEIVGSRRMQDRAISIQMDGDNRVAIEIKLHLKLGFRLPKVAAEVQKAVISAVENATGMVVTRFYVLVQAIDAPPPPEEEPTE